jgi:hypothetical protein
MFILFAFRHCHAAVFSDSPRCYYLHLANVLQAGALPERLMAGMNAKWSSPECQMVIASQVLLSILFHFLFSGLVS